MRASTLFVALVAAAAGCTYGPEEQVASVSQIVRLGDSFHALVVVQHDTYRRPAGLNTFPDGGRWKYVQRGAAQYLIDARALEVVPLARQPAPENVWESFSAWIVGLDGDSVAYLRLTGCPRGGQCYPLLQESVAYRLSARGELRPIESVPPSTGLPGQMAARRPGEQNYVRFSTQRDTVMARFVEDGLAEALFVARTDGTLSPVER